MHDKKRERGTKGKRKFIRAYAENGSMYWLDIRVCFTYIFHYIVFILSSLCKSENIHLSYEKCLDIQKGYGPVKLKNYYQELTLVLPLISN